MSAPDGDGHPTDPDGNRVAHRKSRAVQRFDRNAFIETELTQAPTVAFGQ